MVKKSTIIFWSILASVDVGLILHFLLAHRGRYLYMRLNDVPWFHIALLLLLNVLAVSIFFAIKRRLWVLSGILTPISVLLTIGALLLNLIPGIWCWHSELDDYEKYIGVDSPFNEEFEIAGLKLFDDITDMDVEKTENFYYRYIGFIAFEFEFCGKFYFSNQEYEGLKARFSGTEGFKEIIYSTEEQSLHGFTGYYQIDESVKQAAASWVYNWYAFDIQFSDEECAIYFNFFAGGGN